MKRSSEKVVGILGGMGPEATIDFMQRIIKLTPAQDDCDHIRMLVDNNPKVPSRIKAIVEKTGENPAPVLIEMAQGLEERGADFLVLPCNTAHFYFDQVRNAVKIPILHMVELTVLEIVKKQSDIRSVGLLSSTAVLLTGIFQNICEQHGIELQYPSEYLQQKVLTMIKRVKAGSVGEADIQDVQNAADYLVTHKAEALIIGCTELSIICNNISVNVPIYDSSQVLAKQVVKLIKSDIV